MNEPIEFQDEGFVTFKFNGNEVTLDFYRTHNELVDVSSQNPDAVKQGDAIVAFMAEKGFGTCSHAAAFIFQKKVFKRMDEIRKKEQSADSPSETPSSPDSTDSPSSD